MNSAQPPSKRRRWRVVVAAFCLGAVAGVYCHYILYRLALPSTPFIYVAF